VRAPLKILIIGTLPPPLGGVTVLLNYLIESLQTRTDVDVQAVDTGIVRGHGLGGLLKSFRAALQIVGAVPRADVVTLHCATSSIAIKGTFVLLLAKLFRKPIVIRKFGGADYGQSGARGWWPALAAFVLRRADIYFAETKQLVEQAHQRGLKHAEWFPNHRPLLNESADEDASIPRQRCRRFIYVGHVRECKGIEVLAEAARQLPDDVSIDVYGPWFDDLDRALFNDIPTIRYCDSLRSEEVIPTMRRYDAFVFPTHHAGEGYPGAVLEAFSANLPIVATRWRALPEIVDDRVGLLIEPRNPTQLAEAMVKLADDTDLYQRLRRNTQDRAEFFSVKHWTNEFVRRCEALRRGDRTHSH